MKHWRARENRKSVRIGARVRTDEGWLDATIGNVSSSGMMLHSVRPLRRNQFVEIARGRFRVVGRIVWSDAGAFGLQARESIDIDGLLARATGQTAIPEAERRPVSRAAARTPSSTQRAETSRPMARAFEKAFVVLALASVSIVAVSRAL